MNSIKNLSAIKLKVCGMREAENIQQVAALLPDYMGFIFYAPSKRNVENLDTKTLAQLPSNIKKTGVFVNTPLVGIREKIARYKLDAVQLHGNESPEFCAELKDTGTELIKAFGVDEDFNFTLLNKYQSYTDYFLFDTKTKLHGGSGLTFNWDLLENYQLDKPYFLSGGLDNDNIEQAMQLNDSRFYALDVNSKYELSPALKDLRKLEILFNKIKQHPAKAETM